MTTWKRGINPIGPSVGEAVVIIHKLDPYHTIISHYDGCMMIIRTGSEGRHPRETNRKTSGGKEYLCHSRAPGVGVPVARVFEKPCQTRTPTSALILLVVLVKIGRGGADVLHYSVHLLCPCRAGVQQLSEDAEQPSRLRGRTEQVNRQATHRVSAASSRVLLAVVFRCADAFV